MTSRRSSGSSRAEEGGRADKVAEHHCELAALGLARSIACLGNRRPHSGHLPLAEGRDRVEQSTPMADRGYAGSAQILGCQPAQNFPVDIIVAKHGRILSEPESAEPLGHIHRNCPKTPFRRISYTPIAARRSADRQPGLPTQERQ